MKGCKHRAQSYGLIVRVACVTLRAESGNLSPTLSPMEMADVRGATVATRSASPEATIRAARRKRNICGDVKSRCVRADLGRSRMQEMSHGELPPSPREVRERI